MTTDERTPGAEAPAEQSGAEAPDEDDVGKNLIRQLVIVGGIVFLVMMAAFFGAF